MTITLVNRDNARLSQLQNLSEADWQRLHGEHVLELRSRYNQVFRRFSEMDAIVIHSGTAARKNTRDDQFWPIVATPHFAHWTPYSETPAMLVILPAVKPCLYQERHTSFWEGPTTKSSHWDISSFDVELVDSLNDLPPFKHCVFIGDELACAPSTSASGLLAAEVMKMLDLIRTRKTPYEIASIQAATKIAASGHYRLRDLFLGGGPVSELDLHYEYLRTTKQTDFSVPYGDIVALGANAGILHHVHYGRAERSGDLSFLLDAGATMNGLASDITRTWVRGNSRGASLFRDLVAKVEVVQQHLCDEFKVGTAYEALHNKAHDLLADALCHIGLTSESSENLVSSGATRCLFPHGLGHSLGIQVHDVGMKFAAPSAENPYLRNTAVIEESQVVTVEPGVYFIESLLVKLKSFPIGSSFDWDKIELLKPFGGVRIEDNVLATKDGPVNLTRAHIP
ncbi:MAG: Xaa-Pro dipeptidase [Proteobacteria bacterium]|nr:Xaa-Pro dipeptidase [Pseudomonadota bacterium]